MSGATKSGRRERGVELGYAEVTANTTTTSTSATDLTGLSITIVVTDRPIKLIFDCRSIRNPTANGGTVFQITDSANNVLVNADYLSNPAGLRIALHRERRLAPAPGTYTYKARWLAAAGTATLEASADSPTFLQAVEL